MTKKSDKFLKEYEALCRQHDLYFDAVSNTSHAGLHLCPITSERDFRYILKEIVVEDNND